MNMRQALRALLLAACGLTAGCETVQALKDYANPFETSGTSKADEVEGVLALGINPSFTAEGGGSDAAAVQQAAAFAQSFARKVSDELPERLRQHGVAIHDPGRGVPLLRLRIADHRNNCDTHSCELEMRLDGAVLDSGGNRVWSFSVWLTPAEMDAKGYSRFYDDLLALMVKDQVIPPTT